MHSFSSIIVGVMRWGIWGANHSPKQVAELIEHSISLGFTTFDHADIYGGYTTESLFGKAWKELQLPREQIQLISKCGIQYPGGTKPHKIKSYNYSKSYIIACVEESLQHLQTDYLDLLLLHRPSPLMQPLEIAAAFEELKTAGKVKQFGVSNFSTEQFAMIHHVFPLVTNQVEVSLMQPNALFDHTLFQQMELGLQPQAWSPIGGFFGEETPQIFRINEAIKPIAQKYQVSESVILLAWLRHHPSRMLPVIGTSRKGGLSDAHASLSVELTNEEWFILLEASQGKRVP